MINLPGPNDFYFTKIPSDQKFYELINPLLQYSVGSNKQNEIFDELKPLNEKDARPKSLSSIFGLKELPFHTDCAYYRTPPKYIILRNMCQRSECRTILISPTEIRKSFPATKQTPGIWGVKRTRASFYTNLVTKNFFRWDSEIMKPLDKKARQEQQSLSEMIKGVNKIAIRWQEYGDTLVINNWYWLHAREKFEDKMDRKLLRVLVTENVDL